MVNRLRKVEINYPQIDINSRFLSLLAKFRIVLINSYPINKISEMCKAGNFPRHHLFGTLELKETYNIESSIPEHIKYPFLNRIGKWFDIEFLDQQIRILTTLRKCDIVYAPFAATNTKLIILLKAMGFISKPVVILVHQPLFGKPSKYRLKRLLVKKLIMSYDAMIFFSSKMREELIQAYDIGSDHAERHCYLASLGADIDYFNKFIRHDAVEQNPYLISSGNTGRDFDILIKVAERVNVPLKIYCKPESCPKSNAIPANVEILSGEFPFEQICNDIANARIVLIPLASRPKATIGLVSLLESMALGKPVIMTKNKYIDIDFEKENIGMSVDEEDVDGWVRAISSLIHDQKRLKEMGDNSLRLARQVLNINNFSKDLAKAMNDTYERCVDRDLRQDL
jgi:glycosyltransferase involved in cell wall biosynthesis